MRRNAFTLVELLAVIAILAIISLIAVPIVINIINNAKEESLKKSVHFYIDALEKNISNRQTNDPDYEPDECIIQENGNVICSQNGEELKIPETSNELEISMKGKKPSSGTIRLQDGKVIYIEDIYLNEKYANFDEKQSIVFFTVPFPTNPGLYDANRKPIANWEETKEALGLDLDNGYLHCPADEEYGEEICVRDTNTLSNAKILVISDEVESISGNFMEEAAFEGLTGLTDVIIPNGVTSIGGAAFRNCTGLKNITIPDSVTEIGAAAFMGCTGLTNITIPSSVTILQGNDASGGAFEDCTGLTSVTFENNSQLTSIGFHAFSGCTGLTSIAIPNSVTSIGWGAFSGCKNLTSITIPNNVTSIENYAFLNCKGLTSITIPNSVTSIGNWVFSGCSGLTSIKVETGNTVYEDRNSNAIIGKSTNTLLYGCKNTIIPNSVTSIGSGAFEGCTGLTSIAIPDSITSIGSYAFEDCTGLTSITFNNTTGWYLTNWNNSEHTDIDVTNASTNATNLKSTHSDKYWKRS